jgi:hypothetical protein
MGAELALCAHLASLASGEAAPEVSHAFLFQDGPIDAIVRCRACGAHALLRLLDWAPPTYSLRVYVLAPLRGEDVALYLRDVARGSCQVSRASAELAALIAAAGRNERLVALDLARERVAAGVPLARGIASEPGEFPARLPRSADAHWFAALGLEKSTERRADA